MNHIAQYRNGLHHQIHHNPVPTIHNFTARFPTPNLGPLPDNVMIPQIVSDSSLQYLNGPIQQFISGTDIKQQQIDNSDKDQSNNNKPTINRSFHTGPSSMNITTPAPSCSTREEPSLKGPESSSVNEIRFKTTPSSTLNNLLFIQHCDQGPKNCVHCYSLIKGEPSRTISTFKVDASTMTDEELDPSGNWTLISNSSPQPNTKVTDYLSNLREFLKVDQKPHEIKKPRQGDIRIVTSPDGSRLYFCPECHAAYPDKSLLEPHLAAHKIERRFICNVCGAGLKRKEHLDRHQLSHSEERPFSCTVCSKTFKRNEHLSRHSVTHSGLKPQKERPWLCGVCGTSHIRKEHLERHLLTHSDERPFPCPMCPKAFKHSEHLSRHLVIHSGLKTQDRPWVCGVCGLGHARKEHLERHQVSHSDLRPYSCPSCSKTFKRGEHLSRHLVIHSGQKTELCRECGKTFYRKDHLRKHAESHHKKRKPSLIGLPPHPAPMILSGAL